MGFEFFFDNPFLFIVLVAVLSSLFKKRKRNTEGERTPYSPKENKQTKPVSPFDEVKEIFKEVTRSLSEGTITPDQKIERPVVEQKAEEIHQQIAKAEPLKRERSQSVPTPEES